MHADVEEFINKHLKLLRLEQEAESQSYQDVLSSNSPRILEKMGYGLFNLVINEHCIGMYGRHIITLQKIHHGNLGSVCVKSGDIISVGTYSTSAMPKNENDLVCSSNMGSRGTVTKISSHSITVACDSLPTGMSDGNWHNIRDVSIVKVPSDVTYKRLNRVLNRALNGIGANGISPVSDSLISVLFALKEAQKAERLDVHPSANVALTDLANIGDAYENVNKFFNPNLNRSQTNCVHFCLKQKHLAVVHGPPGTGKTTTVVETILQEVCRGNKLIVCAPSNVAVDNLVDQLTQYSKIASVSMVRLGHPARASESGRLFTLDSLILQSDFSDVIRDLRNEIFKSKQILSTSSENSGLIVKEAAGKISHLKKDLKELEEKCVKEIIMSCNIVLSTCTSAHEDGALRILKNLMEPIFDVCVIDESGQALEAECWIPLVRAKKIILAGDHMQLPPTVMSPESASQGLGISLLERVVDKQPDCVMLLDIQYRMNESIMRWASRQFYQDKLKVGSVEIQERMLQDVISNFDEELSFLNNCAMMLINTDGCEMLELDAEFEESKGNEFEADLVAYHVKTLLKLGVPQKEIAVISPYNLQIELIRGRLSELYPNLEVKSVDGFQGREKDAIVLSLVRSNKNFEIGFLKESRRLNVAITRAKRHVCVIGDSQTISIDPTLKSLVDYIEQEGIAFPATDYLDKPDMEWTFLHRPKFASSSEVKLSSKPKTVQTKKNVINNQDPSYFDKDKLKAEIQAFAEKQNKTELKFPKTLSAAARAFIHEEAEKLNLNHNSVGGGSGRRIVISKAAIIPWKSTATEQMETVNAESYSGFDDQTETSGSNVVYAKEESNLTENNVSSETEKKARSKKEKKKTNSFDILSQQEEVGDAAENQCHPLLSSFVTKADPTTLCSICFKKVPESNFNTHVVHCAKLNRNQEQNQSKTSAEPGNYKEKTKKKIDALENDDFDEICGAFQQLNSVCNEAKCKTSILTLSFKCNYCEIFFCSTHRCPETHACGRGSVKRAARERMRNPPPPVRTSQAQTSAVLHGKVKGKIEEMRKGRASKRGNNSNK